MDAGLITNWIKGFFSRTTAAGAILLVAGCQQESDLVSPIPPDKAITIDSPVAQLLQRLVMLDGSTDNILDKKSCSSLVYPVTVTVNGQSRVITSDDDLDEIEHIFDLSGSDEDSVIIQFPVTLVMPDYSSRIIQNQAEWEALAPECTEGGDDDDLECLDLIYPISIATYDTVNQKSSVLTLSTDKEVFQFLEQASMNVLIALQFPVTLTDSSGTVHSVADYEQLEDLLLSNDDCDEDDDNDFDDDDLDTSALEAILLTGTWEIDTYLDGTDQSSLFAGYIFSYQGNGQATAEINSNVTMGSWMLYGDSGTLEWVLNFGSEEPLKELNEDWKVTSFSDTIIELTDKPGDPEGRTLTFKKQ
jgi:hypothetical protein